MHNQTHTRWAETDLGTVENVGLRERQGYPRGSPRTTFSSPLPTTLAALAVCRRITAFEQATKGLDNQCRHRRITTRGQHSLCGFSMLGDLSVLRRRVFTTALHTFERLALSRSDVASQVVEYLYEALYRVALLDRLCWRWLQIKCAVVRTTMLSNSRSGWKDE